MFSDIFPPFPCPGYPQIRVQNSLFAYLFGTYVATRKKGAKNQIAKMHCIPPASYSLQSGCHRLHSFAAGPGLFSPKTSPPHLFLGGLSSIPKNAQNSPYILLFCVEGLMCLTFNFFPHILFTFLIFSLFPIFGLVTPKSPEKKNGEGTGYRGARFRVHHLAVSQPVEGGPLLEANQ